MRVTFLLPALLLLGGCPDGDLQLPAPTKTGAGALSMAVTLPAAPDLKLSSARIVLRADWGSGPRQLGMSDEASRPGPMSLAVAEDGAIHLLDQVNKRIQRFTAGGQLMAPLPLSGETAEYIALSARAGQVWTLSYLRNHQDKPRFSLELVGARGVLRQRLLPADTELVTGLFTAGGEVWVEQAHHLVTRVAPAASGSKVIMGRPYLGRPGHHVAALKSGRGVKVAGVSPGDTTYELMAVEPPPGYKLEAIEGLESDKAGRIYLALLLVRQGSTRDHDQHWLGMRRVAVIHHPGVTTRPIMVELAADQATDMNNYLAAGPRSGLYQLQTTNQGILVRRWGLEDGEVRP